jgi:photosynthetic reaction center cytochrome c subunit
MMGEKGRIDLRSNGKPRAAVPRSLIWLAVVFVICCVVIGGAKAQSAGAPGSKTAALQFKNIQVLKDIPGDQLIPSMQFITASLGVECEFCHVQGAFEKDDKKPKQTARKMMEMMIAINQENFEGKREVTCYSCHRGSTNPVATPVVMTADSKPAMVEPKEIDEAQAKETGGPGSEHLFDRYVKAVGGTAAIDKITSRVMKGTVTFGDRNVPIEIYSKGPDKRMSVTHTPNGDSITAFDGQEGWLGILGHPLHDMHGPDIDGASMDADLQFAAHLNAMFSEAKVEGREKIDGHDAYVVVGPRPGKTPLRLYFDEQSGLLVRLVRLGETPLGELPTQIDFADYREAGGVKIPFRWTLARPSGRFTIQVSDVKENVPVDDAKFAKPAPPPPEQKGSTK